MKRVFILLVVLIFCLCSCKAAAANTNLGHPPAVSASAESAPEESLPAESLPAGSAPEVQTKIIQTFVDSKLLNKKMPINVYLPTGYTKEQEYPVLYFLHGDGAVSDDDVFSLLGMDDAAEKLIAAGTIKPVIIASVHIDRSYGVNSAEKPDIVYIQDQGINVGMYESYVTTEAVPFIDVNYSTVSSKEGRYIGGISMAGFAALHIAFRNTELFSKVGGHSPAVDSAIIPYKLLFPTADAVNEGDPNKISQIKDLSGLKIWLDCGDKDPYCQNGTEILQSILEAMNWDVEYLVGSGEHNNDYWQSNLEKYLAFYNS